MSELLIIKAPQLFSINEIASFVIFIIGFIGIIFKMFDISTLIYIGMILYSVSVLYKLACKQLFKYGLINLLPNNIRYFLLNRSVLDILMDFWHLPSVTKYFKFLFVPIIYNYSPEESIEAMKELDYKTLKYIQTKGIINLCPDAFKKLMLPCDSLIDNNCSLENCLNSNVISEKYDKKSTEDQSIEDNNINNISNKEEYIEKPFKDNKNNNVINNYNNNTDNNNSNNNILSNNSLVKINNKSIESIQKINKLEIKKSSEKQIIDINNNSINKCYSEPNKIIIDENVKKILLPQIKEDGDKVIYYGHDLNSGKKYKYKSIVIQSTKKLEQGNLNKKPYVWDNHQLYNQLQKSNRKPSPKLNIIDVLKSHITKQIINKVNLSYVYKGTAAFSVFLILQILINKRIRNYSASFLQISVFALTSFLSTYSIFVLINSVSGSNILSNQNKLINNSNNKHNTRNNFYKALTCNSNNNINNNNIVKKENNSLSNKLKKSYYDSDEE